jgi:hypothetical protein
VIVLGDVHRRWEEAAETIERAGLRGRTIIQVGDFGLGFGDREFGRTGDTYWPDESVVLDLARLEALDLGGLAAVVTHTAPASPRRPSTVLIAWLEVASRR